MWLKHSGPVWRPEYFVSSVIARQFFKFRDIWKSFLDNTIYDDENKATNIEFFFLLEVKRALNEWMTLTLTGGELFCVVDVRIIIKNCSNFMWRNLRSMRIFKIFFRLIFSLCNWQQFDAIFKIQPLNLLKVKTKLIEYSYACVLMLMTSSTCWFWAFEVLWHQQKVFYNLLFISRLLTMSSAGVKTVKIVKWRLALQKILPMVFRFRSLLLALLAVAMKHKANKTISSCICVYIFNFQFCDSSSSIPNFFSPFYSLFSFCLRV